jgi:hypothetical protein
MNKVNWLEIITGNENRVREAIRKCHEDAWKGWGFSGSTISITMNADGEISDTFIENNSTDGEVYAGKAIYLARVPTVLDIEYGFDDILAELDETELRDFLMWCHENDEMPSMETVSEWDDAIVGTAVDAIREGCAEANIDSDTDMAWDGLIEHWQNMPEESYRQ